MMTETEPPGPAKCLRFIKTLWQRQEQASGGSAVVPIAARAPGLRRTEEPAAEEPSPEPNVNMMMTSSMPVGGGASESDDDPVESQPLLTTMPTITQSPPEPSPPPSRQSSANTSEKMLSSDLDDVDSDAD